MTVLGILSPRLVRLGHKGGEYEVDFLADAGSNLFEPFRASNARVLGDPPSPRSTESGDSGYRPSAGDRVRVEVEVNGARREITGRIDSISGSGGRALRITPDGGGPARTVTRQQLVTISPIDGDAAADETSDPEESEEETDETLEEETDEEEIDSSVPPPISEAQFRSMSRAELEAAYPPRAQALERSDLDANTVSRLQWELTIIHDLLRPTPPDP